MTLKHYLKNTGTKQDADAKIYRSQTTYVSTKAILKITAFKHKRTVSWQLSPVSQDIKED